jgi:hypothetical protein
MQDALWRAVWVTLTDPREGARTVLGWRLGWRQIGLVTATCVALSLLAQSLRSALLPVPEAEGVAPLPLLVVGMLMLAALAVTSLVIHWVGRLFGGQGELEAVAGVVTWVNLVDTAFLAIPLLGVILPAGLANLLFLGGVAWSIWILACFVAAVHRFPSPAKVMAVGLVLTAGLALVLAILMTAAGIGPPGGP